jgi:hypothetical protein
VFDFDPETRHLCVPTLFHLGAKVEGAGKRRKHNRGNPVCRIPEYLISAFVFVLRVFLEKAQKTRFGEKPIVVVAAFNGAEKMAKQTVREYHCLVLQGVVVLVAVIALALKVRWPANPSDGAIDEADYRIDGCPCIPDGGGVGFEFFGGEDTMRVVVQKVAPAIVEKADEFVDEDGYSSLGAIEDDGEMIHVP